MLRIVFSGLKGSLTLALGHISRDCPGENGEDIDDAPGAEILEA